MGEMWGYAEEKHWSASEKLGTRSMSG